MSRRSLQKRKVLGRPRVPTGTGIGQPRHEDHGSGCQGDKSKFQSTRPSTTVHGTGKWLNKGSGVGRLRLHLL